MNENVTLCSMNIRFFGEIQIVSDLDGFAGLVEKFLDLEEVGPGKEK